MWLHYVTGRAYSFAAGTYSWACEIWGINNWLSAYLTRLHCFVVMSNFILKFIWSFYLTMHSTDHSTEHKIIKFGRTLQPNWLFTTTFGTSLRWISSTCGFKWNISFQPNVNVDYLLCPCIQLWPKVKFMDSVNLKIRLLSDINNIGYHCSFWVMLTELLLVVFWHISKLPAFQSVSCIVCCRAAAFIVQYRSEWYLLILCLCMMSMPHSCHTFRWAMKNGAIWIHHDDANLRAKMKWFIPKCSEQSYDTKEFWYRIFGIG